MELSEVEVAHRSRLSTFIKTCPSECKAGENQQVVTTSDQLLAPSSSPLSRLFYYHLSQLLLRFHDGSFVGANPAAFGPPKQGVGHSRYFRQRLRRNAPCSAVA